MLNNYQNIKETLKKCFSIRKSDDRTHLNKLIEACAPNNAGFVDVFV